MYLKLDFILLLTILHLSKISRRVKSTAIFMPNYERASRKLEFIEKSVDWIKEIIPPSSYPLLLDIGCGPGIYAERFFKMGYQVTGIDFSKRSIDYAQNSARKQGLDITYLYQNYLNMDLDKTFDFATMIYCDYGALSAADRKIVMKRG